MTRSTRARASILPVLAFSGAQASAAAWPDTPVARLEVLLELQTLNAELLSHDSATLTLDRWCAGHRLAKRPTVVADRVDAVEAAVPKDVRTQLEVDPSQKIAHRRVRLRCGDRVLSEADNWYVPSKLTAAMNETLATSDAAFGRVVQPLRFHRRTLSARLLWSPLPDRWDSEFRLPIAERGRQLSIPPDVIEHRAVLTASDGRPFSYVVETYKSAVLDFQPIPLPR